MRQSFLPGFEVPFVLVDVELGVQEDLRLVGRLIDGPDAPLRLGAPVRHRVRGHRSGYGGARLHSHP